MFLPKDMYHSPVPRPRMVKVEVCVVAVFVVEDDKAVRESLVLFLRQVDLQPVAYESAEALLNAERLGPDDTVFVDIGLPGMSGAELIHCLYQRAGRPRIIVVSGKPQHVLERELSCFEEAQILRKPLDADSLASIFPENGLH